LCHRCHVKPSEPAGEPTKSKVAGRERGIAMGEVTLIVEHEIKPGRLADFTRLAHELIARTRTEPGAVRYDYHLSEDGRRDVNIEVFRDADAVLVHSRNVADLLPSITDAAPIVRLDVIGDVSAELRAEIAAVATGYFALVDGLDREPGGA
jgi:quinol monooxygenase YgiN